MITSMRKIIFAALLCIPSLALADGKATYDKNCASCHGADGTGNATKAKILKLDPASLNLGRAETANATAAELKEIVLKGKAKMPAYEKKLAAEEIDPVVEYTMKLAAAIRGAK